MFTRTKSGAKILWCMLESDAQDRAEEIIGRKLTDDELMSVQKGLDSGFGSWVEVMDTAIECAVNP